MPAQTTGNITAAGAANAITLSLGNNDTLATFLISGTYNGLEVVFEASRDGTVYFPIAALRQDTYTIEKSDVAFAVATNATRAWQISLPGMSNVRLRPTALQTGTVAVQAASGIFFDQAPISAVALIGPLGQVLKTASLSFSMAADQYATPTQFNVNTVSPTLQPAGGPGPISPVPVKSDDLLNAMMGVQSLLREMIEVLHAGL